MWEAVARWVVLGFEAYVACGVVFAAAFLPRAVARLDPGMAAAPVTLRFVLLPGIVALWPVFARRWWRDAPAPEEKNAHRLASRRQGVTS